MRARQWMWLHFGLGMVWALLVVPTLLWWRDSIMWVAFMSLYANIAGHMAAAQAAHGEDHQQT